MPASVASSSLLSSEDGGVWHNLQVVSATELTHSMYAQMTKSPGWWTRWGDARMWTHPATHGLSQDVAHRWGLSITLSVLRSMEERSEAIRRADAVWCRGEKQRMLTSLWHAVGGCGASTASDAVLADEADMEVQWKACRLHVCDAALASPAHTANRVLSAWLRMVWTETGLQEGWTTRQRWAHVESVWWRHAVLSWVTEWLAASDEADDGEGPDDRASVSKTRVGVWDHVLQPLTTAWGRSVGPAQPSHHHRE